MHPLHPMLVHFPIALLTTSVAFEALAMRWPSERLRASSLDMLVVGVLAAVAAVVSGHLAEEAVENRGIPEQVLEWHEGLGFATFWIFAGVLAMRVAMAWGLLRDRPIWPLLLGLVGIAVLLVAGYFGGELVYRFGAGVSPP